MSARTAVDQGRYAEALRLYSFMASEFSDLALSEYARVGQVSVMKYHGTSGMHV